MIAAKLLAASAASAAAAAAAAAHTKRGRGSRTTNDRPPPGAVNLERSYEICRAVIQNSPNRHQLKAQLRPPPSMLAKNVQITSSATVQATTVQKFVKKLPEEQATVKFKVVFLLFFFFSQQNWITSASSPLNIFLIFLIFPVNRQQMDHVLVFKRKLHSFNVNRRLC